MRLRKRGGLAVKFHNMRVFALLPLLALCLGLCACHTISAPAETRIFAMDTVMNLTVYGKGAQEQVDAAVEQLYQLDRTFSAADPGSAIFALNDSQGAWTFLGETAADLLGQALKLCSLTEGALDLTAYPAVRAWGFLSGDYRVPDQQELDELAGRIDYAAVELDMAGLRARMPAGMALDLGSVAKGYAGDLLASQLREAGVTSALLDLGQSSIQTVGAKPDGSPWRIGILDPRGSSYLGIVELEDMAMGTSGGYQRFFEQGGQTYWHIMDPGTAAPARSGLSSVTVVGPSGLVCDGLSTALFVMGQDRGAQLWRDHPELDIEVIFIDEQGGIAITGGLEDNFTLAQGYEDREVTVLR